MFSESQTQWGLLQGINWVHFLQWPYYFDLCYETFAIIMQSQQI